jgi:hypothetical protein
MRKVPSPNTLTNRDRLSVSAICQWVRRNDPEYYEHMTFFLDKPYSRTNSLFVINSCLLCVRRHVLAGDSSLAYMMDFPDEILTSSKVMEALLSSPAYIDMLKSGKINYNGIVRLIEGRI